MNLRAVADRLHIPEPAAKRRTLEWVAGVLWIAVGLLLLGRAIVWMLAAHTAGVIAAVIGLVLGIFKSRFVFIPLASKNVERIKALSPDREKICIFAFQAMKAYLLIAAMIALGILLRLSPLPRPILIAIYVTVGSALLFASPKYLRAS
jgi:hypothetical protein